MSEVETNIDDLASTQSYNMKSVSLRKSSLNEQKMFKYIKDPLFCDNNGRCVFDQNSDLEKIQSTSSDAQKREPRVKSEMLEIKKTSINNILFGSRCD